VTAVVDVRGLVKSFGGHRALAGLDLEVGPGEVHGFLGPNGAGKSTTLRILLGLLRSDGGTAHVFGLNPWRDAVRVHGRLAYVPGDVTLWPDLSGGETVDLLLRMRGVRPDRAERDALVERFDLDPTKRGRAYSRGNRQKVALVAALAGNADLLLLDEPTAGLDPLMEQVFRECVRERALRGTTVLLSSHILSEVESLADRVTIINAGRVVETGALTDLRRLRRTCISATTAKAVRLDDVPGLHDLVVDGSTVRCTVDPEALTTVMRRLSEAGTTALTSSPPSLEDLFLDAYRHPVDAGR
jgi:ABC-2 type transport system ATP-binding protein